MSAPRLLYADRCERYSRQRGWDYDPRRMSIDHLTPAQRRRALRKERAVLAPAGRMSPEETWQDDADYAEDDDYDNCAGDTCSHCGGEWYLQECDDPLQCCNPRCDGTWHPCDACNGTGLARNQWMW